MNRIMAKEKVVNNGEVETRFAGKNLTSVGGMKFFHKFVQKLGETSISLLSKVRNDFKDWIRLTLDFDSHVETVYGNQQRAKVGYNPKKPGRKSFHPLPCFVGETRDFLWGGFALAIGIPIREQYGF